MNIRQSYREGVVGGATPIDLVVRLYEQMIEDMRHVGIAIEQNDIERRTSRINHAILIIAHLQSSLDFENGGTTFRDGSPQSGENALFDHRPARLVGHP